MGLTPTVTVRIDRLVLDGAGPADAARLQRAVERELARLVTEGGLHDGLRDSSRTPRADGGTIPPAATADALGAHVARAIYRGMSR